MSFSLFPTPLFNYPQVWVPYSRTEPILLFFVDGSFLSHSYQRRRYTAVLDLPITWDITSLEYSEARAVRKGPVFVY